MRSYVGAHKSHLDVNLEYQLCVLPNTKVSTAKDHGRDCIKVKLPRSPFFAQMPVL